MRHSLSLGQQQKQTLHLTTEIRQGISVLCMNAAELSEYAAVCLDENPFLEYDERWDKKYPCEPDKHCITQSAEVLMDNEKRPRRFDEVFCQDAHDDFSFDRYAAERSAVEGNLEAQLEMVVQNGTDRTIGSYLIGNIDSSGYLCIETAEVAENLGVSVARVEEVLKIVQNLYPGIAARSIQECLVLQLEALGEANFLTRCIASDYLVELATAKYKDIARALGAEVSKVQKACELIKSLDPRPGLHFGITKAPVIWPEVAIMRSEKHWEVCLQEFDMPPMIINEAYLPLLKKNELDKPTLEYLQDKLRAAQGLLQGIEQRRQTLYQVASCIVEFQKGFLEEGYEALRPLTMAQVAEALEISESTVSRVANGNYMQTPRGLFEMKYFFSSGITQIANETISSEGIKHRIRHIIDGEDRYHPLSDAAIQEQLKAHDIEVSRRTVNKYRQALGILPASHRRHYRVS